MVSLMKGDLEQYAEASPSFPLLIDNWKYRFVIKVSKKNAPCENWCSILPLFLVELCGDLFGDSAYQILLAERESLIKTISPLELIRPHKVRYPLNISDSHEDCKDPQITSNYVPFYVTEMVFLNVALLKARRTAFEVTTSLRASLGMKLLL
jgi:hypothetical protein